jgi:hypothetical protein
MLAGIAHLHVHSILVQMHISIVVGELEQDEELLQSFGCAGNRDIHVDRLAVASIPLDRVAAPAALLTTCITAMRTFAT